MLRIRLRRVGRKNDPHFQIVVTPKTTSTKGSYLVKLGWFDPVSKQIEVDETNLKKWLDNGAKPTNTVARLLIGKKINHKQIVYVPSKPKDAKSKGKEDAKEAPKVKAESEDKSEKPVKDTEITETPATDEGKEDKQENINNETKKEEV